MGLLLGGADLEYVNGIGKEVTIAEQMKDLDRQGLLDMLDCIVDISSDSTKGQLVYMIQNFRDSIERRKG